MRDVVPTGASRLPKFGSAQKIVELIEVAVNLSYPRPLQFHSVPKRNVFYAVGQKPLGPGRGGFFQTCSDFG
jgi:hypothetical protein